MTDLIFAFGPGLVATVSFCSLLLAARTDSWQSGKLPPKLSQLLTSSTVDVNHIHQLVLGAGDSWFASFRTKSGDSSFSYDGLPDFLVAWLQKRDKHGGTLRDIANLKVSLGPSNESFYVQDGRDHYWENLPPGLERALQTLRTFDGGWISAPRIVAIGKDQSHALITEGGSSSFIVSDNYPYLQNELVSLRGKGQNNVSKTIHHISLDQHAGSNYVMTMVDGGVHYYIPDEQDADMEAVKATVLKTTPGSSEILQTRTVSSSEVTPPAMPSVASTISAANPVQVQPRAQAKKPKKPKKPQVKTQAQIRVLAQSQVIANVTQGADIVPRSSSPRTDSERPHVANLEQVARPMISSSSPSPSAQEFGTISVASRAITGSAQAAKKPAQRKSMVRDDAASIAESKASVQLSRSIQVSSNVSRTPISSVPPTIQSAQDRQQTYQASILSMTSRTSTPAPPSQAPPEVIMGIASSPLAHAQPTVRQTAQSPVVKTLATDPQLSHPDREAPIVDTPAAHAVIQDAAVLVQATRQKLSSAGRGLRNGFKRALRGHAPPTLQPSQPASDSIADFLKAQAAETTRNLDTGDQVAVALPSIASNDQITQKQAQQVQQVRQVQPQQAQAQTQAGDLVAQPQAQPQLQSAALNQILQHQQAHQEQQPQPLRQQRALPRQYIQPPITAPIESQSRGHTQFVQQLQHTNSSQNKRQAQHPLQRRRTGLSRPKRPNAQPNKNSMPKPKPRPDRKALPPPRRRVRASDGDSSVADLGPAPDVVGSDETDMPEQARAFDDGSMAAPDPVADTVNVHQADMPAQTQAFDSSYMAAPVPAANATYVDQAGMNTVNHMAVTDDQAGYAINAPAEDHVGNAFDTAESYKDDLDGASGEEWEEDDENDEDEDDDDEGENDLDEEEPNDDSGDVGNGAGEDDNSGAGEDGEDGEVNFTSDSIGAVGGVDVVKAVDVINVVEVDDVDDVDDISDDDDDDGDDNYDGEENGYEDGDDYGDESGDEYGGEYNDEYDNDGGDYDDGDDE